MKYLLNKLICRLFGHIWLNKVRHPLHGYDNIPYEDSYCQRCGVVASQVLKTDD